MAQAVGQLLDSLFNRNDDWKISLLKQWPEIVGDLAQHVQVEKIKGDTLILAVQDSCWMQELYLLSDLLLKSINQKLDRPRIKRLRFKTKGLPQPKKIKKILQPIKRKTKQITLTEHEQNALDKIQDKQLQQVLKEFRSRIYQESE